MDTNKTYILCPGQGAQAVGMGKDFYDQSSVARDIFARAGKILGWDLAGVCFNGPEDRLNQTDVSQPAIYVTSIAGWMAAALTPSPGTPGEGRGGGPDEIRNSKFEIRNSPHPSPPPEYQGRGQDRPTAFAGLSLGEYTALHLAGVFGFEEGLRLVAARGKYMQEAAVASPSGMVAILGADEAAVVNLCHTCAAGEVLVPANFNAPGQVVVSGSKAACERVLAEVEKAGFKATALKVAGAFHSPLMQSAADKMAAELDKVNFNPPRTTVYSNVTAQPHTDPASIKKLLVQQITQPVRWQQTMETLIAGGEAKFIELPPGRTLAGLAKRINRRLPIESLSLVTGHSSLAAAGAPGESRVPGQTSDK